MGKLSNCLPVSSSFPLQGREFWPRVGARPGTALSALYPFGCGHVHQWNVSRSVPCQKQMHLCMLLLSHPLACVAVWGVLGMHVLKRAELLIQGPRVIVEQMCLTPWAKEKKCFLRKPMTLQALSANLASSTLEKWLYFLLEKRIKISVTSYHYKYLFAKFTDFNFTKWKWFSQVIFQWLPFCPLIFS